MHAERYPRLGFSSKHMKGRRAREKEKKTSPGQNTNGIVERLWNGATLTRTMGGGEREGGVVVIDGVTGQRNMRDIRVIHRRWHR